jgi:hypothetical protein
MSYQFAVFKTKFRVRRYHRKKAMNEQEKDSTREQTDEIGSELETGNQANAAIEQQGDDAAAGILRDTDAAKQEEKKEERNDDHEPAGAP